MMCEECTNDYGKITSSPQFNCHGCWDILQLQLFQRKKENARLREALENVVNGSDIAIDSFSFARKALERDELVVKSFR